MAYWFSDSYRRNLVDMHIEDWNAAFFSRFDPKRYVDLLCRARIQSAMVYANSHVGYCYWPCKTGQMHTGLGNRDILGEIIKHCHSHGIHVILYYSLIFNNWAYEEHPEWRMVNRAGIASRENGGEDPLHNRRYGICCPNNQEYRNFEKRQINELCNAYDFEGMFFDMNFWPKICYCDSCRLRFSEEVGRKIPEYIDWSDPEWLLFQRMRENWLAEHACFVSEIVKSVKPELTVEHNSATLPRPWYFGANLGLLAANDYLGGDLYGGFFEQSFICKLFTSLTPQHPFEYMTSRCYPDIRDHTTVKSKDMLRLHTLLALAHNGAFLFIDAVNLDGTMNESSYNVMGEVFTESSRYEAFVGGDLCADVAVYFSLDSKYDPAETGILVGEQNMDRSVFGPHFDAAFGAARALKEHHIPFGVISRSNIGQLDRYKVLVLPNVLILDEEAKNAVIEYLVAGGRVYLSGHSITHFADYGDFHYDTLSRESVTYMAPTERGINLLPLSSKNAPLTILGRQFVIEPVDSARICAELVLPATLPEDSEQFASIHTDPPFTATGRPSLFYCKGNRILAAAAAIEAVNSPPHTASFISSVKELADESFTVESDAPPAVEIITYHQPDQRRFIISALNTQELLPPVTAYDIKIIFRIKWSRVSRIILLPDEEELEYVDRKDEVEFRLPPLELMHMICIDYIQ